MLLASFAARGLIALPIALVMMLGADVGTTIVAQVFSFDVKWLWTVLVGARRARVHVDRSATRRAAIARIGIGLGLMLLSLMHLGERGRAARNIRRCSARCSTGLAGDPLLGFFVAVALSPG